MQQIIDSVYGRNLSHDNSRLLTSREYKFFKDAGIVVRKGKTVCSTCGGNCGQCGSHWLLRDFEDVRKELGNG